jgi:ribosomal protein L11 methylase PrmA
MSEEALGASFRDPSGFVFLRDGAVHRRVERSYASHYEHLMSSGLYEELSGAGLLVAHQEVPGSREDGEGHLTLRPEPIPFVSHPYEWCFGQLKDAALLTLRIQRAALRRGMTLKDASAYNVQFLRGRPVFIDTLSFETWNGRPWPGYRQFCQHFLAPLALAAFRDVRLLQLLRVHLDGVPLDLARELLPARTWWNPHLLVHLRIHARYQRRHQGRADPSPRERTLKPRAAEGLVSALSAAVRGLRWEPGDSEWSGYADGDSYAAGAAERKRALVRRHLEQIRPARLFDLGANTGEYSRVAADLGIETVSFDADPACVERSYRELRAAGETRVLPLVQDLANPSPALGWAGRERPGLAQRPFADAVLALALVHHLAIGHNVPLPLVTGWFAELAPHAVVEFVPKSDPKVGVLLATREDVFPGYTREGFEAAFGARFEILEAAPIGGSERILYRMRRREPPTSSS